MDAILTELLKIVPLSNVLVLGAVVWIVWTLKQVNVSLVRIVDWQRSHEEKDQIRFDAVEQRLTDLQK
mgnify:FL=1